MKPDILNQIVEVRRQRIESAKRELPLERIRDSVSSSDRDFAAALRDPRPAFILECKRSSPSRGTLRPDFDIAAIARVYARWASAISVLTEPDWFGGDLEFLRIVRQTAPQPLLCKDFIIDPWQVYAARYFGADAILLILAILDDPAWRHLAGLAGSLGMAVLTEVSDSHELDRAICLQAPIVGINNRNLRDMTVDLQTALRLAAAIPRHVLVIGESGYSNNAQVRDASPACGGFLCGSALMERCDLNRSVKRLIFGDHKVCGLVDAEAARTADEAGAVYGGVIFADTSVRRVTPEQARDLLAPTDLIRVGVFLNAEVDEVRRAVEIAGLERVQWHGHGTPERVRNLRSALAPEVAIWPALDPGRVGEIPRFLEAGAERIVLDQPAAGGGGGTGRTWDWRQLPAFHRDRIMLAGGLGIDCVDEALKLGVAGLDFNSSLESAPGRKSPQRIADLFQRIRRY